MCIRCLDLNVRVLQVLVHVAQWYSRRNVVDAMVICCVFFFFKVEVSMQNDSSVHLTGRFIQRGEGGGGWMNIIKLNGRLFNMKLLIHIN